MQLPRQFSTIINSTRSSFLSLPGRRNSVTSVLSFSERRASFQLGRRTSDVSLGSIDKPSRGNDTKLSSANNSFLVKSTVMFSPIHEHNEESSDSEIPQQNVVNLTICLDPTMEIMVLSEEPKAVTGVSYLKCTEV